MMPSRRRGITYAEVLVATIFLAVCTASVLDGLQSSTDSLKLAQRRQYVLYTMQGVLEESRYDLETATPVTGTTTRNFVIPNGGEATLTKTVAVVAGKNLATVALTTTWPERRASRDYTESATLEQTVKTLEN
jgi:type II secretory pathway pseudopilin PulG